MGRGISELQRWILEEARARGRLYYSDICEGYYGWKQHSSYGSHGGPGCNKFSREEIGKAEYNRVMATISRACLRLERRGLVRCIRGLVRWAAVEPVSSTEALAEELEG